MYKGEEGRVRSDDSQRDRKLSSGGGNGMSEGRRIGRGNDNERRKLELSEVKKEKGRYHHHMDGLWVRGEGGREQDAKCRKGNRNR